MVRRADQVSFAATCPKCLVDPTGLKPAPHGLKGRRSVTRAPGQHLECGDLSPLFFTGRGKRRQVGALHKMAVAEGLEPSIAGLTIRCLTNLATPQRNWLRRRDSNSYHLVYKTSALFIQLSYAAIWWTGRDSNPHKKFAGLLCSRLHHQPENFGGCGWSRTTNLALMRRLL